MPDVYLREIVPLPPQQAFEVFVEAMDTWWPRQGVFPFSFAPKDTFPRHIRFEAQLRGRYYETFADGSEYTIGRINEWNPPQSLGYSWQDPTWLGKTQIKVQFESDNEGTRVTYTQDGFAAAGVPRLIPYYQIGCAQTCAGFVAHCRALHALRQQGQSLD